MMRRSGDAEGLGSGLRRLMAGHLNDMEVFLRQQLPLCSETELIAPGRRKDQGRNVDAKVRDLEPVADHDVRQRGAAYRLLAVQMHQIDIEMVRALRVGQAEVQAELLMLKRKCDGLQMREDADKAFLPGQAVFDDLVADKKRLYAGLNNVGHRPILCHAGSSATGS